MQHLRERDDILRLKKWDGIDQARHDFARFRFSTTDQARTDCARE